MALAVTKIEYEMWMKIESRELRNRVIPFLNSTNPPLIFWTGVAKE